MIPRVGKPPETGVIYTRRPGAYAILYRSGKILLTYQEQPYSEFQLPGGGIDPGENPLQALAREVREETGWSITRARCLGHFKRFTAMPEYNIIAEKMCSVFVAFPCRNLGRELEAGHSCHWVEPKEALSLVKNPGDQIFLKRFL
jgi:8-oxo-dGTP diphosphatase